MKSSVLLVRKVVLGGLNEKFRVIGKESGFRGSK